MRVPRHLSRRAVLLLLSLWAAVRRWLQRRVSQPHFEGAMKYSDRHLAGLSARPPDRVELIGAGSLGYRTGPSFAD